MSEKTYSAGLTSETILSWVLDKEFDMDLSVLAFFCISVFISLSFILYVFTGRGGDGITRQNESKRDLLKGSFNELRSTSAKWVWLDSIDWKFSFVWYSSVVPSITFGVTIERKGIFAVWELYPFLKCQ